MNSFISLIPKIANILMEDVYLVQNWKIFYDLLEIQSPEIIRKILLLWVSKVGHDASLDNLKNVLKNGSFRYASDNLDQILSLSQTQIHDNYAHFGIKKCIINFMGRESELNFLNEFLQTQNFILVVNGLAGVGKSTLVQKYVTNLILDENAKNIPDIQSILWFQCGHGHTLQESIQKFAEFLAQSNNPSQSILETFKACFHSIQIKMKQKILLIFDNVDENETEFQDILSYLNSQRSMRQIQIIVTSTLLSVTSYSGKFIHLDCLNDEEANSFLKNRLPQTLTMNNEANLIDLTKMVQNLPRMLEQAVDFINKQNFRGIKVYRVEDYVRDFRCGSRQKVQQFLDHPLSPIERTLSHRTTTFKSWTGSLRQLRKLGREGYWAIKMLKFLSYLDNSGWISCTVLKKIINCSTFFMVDTKSSNFKLTATGQERLDKALELLKENHLIDVDAQEETISMHRMLKEVTRIQINQKSPQILHEVMEHIQYNLINSTCQDVNNNYVEENIVYLDDKVSLTVVELWKQVVKYPKLAVRHVSVGVHCTFYPNCPTQLIFDTLKQFLSKFLETDLLLATVKINYFSRLCQDPDESVSCKGIDNLKSLVGQYSLLFSPLHPLVVRARFLLENVLKSNKTKISEYIKVVEESLELSGSVSPLTPEYQRNLHRLLDLAYAYEQNNNFYEAIEYYSSILLWVRIKQDEKLPVEETHIIEKIKNCCNQAGIPIHNHVNLDNDNITIFQEISSILNNDKTAINDNWIFGNKKFQNEEIIVSEESVWKKNAGLKLFFTRLKVRIKTMDYISTAADFMSVIPHR